MTALANAYVMTPKRPADSGIQQVGVPAGLPRRCWQQRAVLPGGLALACAPRSAAAHACSAATPP